MTLAVGHKITAASAAELRDRCVGRARRDTVGGGAASSTDDEVLLLPDLPVLEDMSYSVRLSCHADSTVATDTVRVTIRYTTDGSDPSTSSPILPGGQAYDTPAPMTIDTTYVPAADEQLSLLVCVARHAGTGTCSLFADGTRFTELKVSFDGLDPGDTGVNL